MGLPGYGDSGERLSLAALVPFLCSLALTLLILLSPTLLCLYLYLAPVFASISVSGLALLPLSDAFCARES